MRDDAAPADPRESDRHRARVVRSRAALEPVEEDDERRLGGAGFGVEPVEIPEVAVGRDHALAAQRRGRQPHEHRPDRLRVSARRASAARDRATAAVRASGVTSRAQKRSVATKRCHARAISGSSAASCAAAQPRTAPTVAWSDLSARPAASRVAVTASCQWPSASCSRVSALRYARLRFSDRAARRTRRRSEASSRRPGRRAAPRPCRARAPRRACEACGGGARGADRRTPGR